MNVCMHEHLIIIGEPRTYLEMKRWMLKGKEKRINWWNKVLEEENGIQLGEPLTEKVSLYLKQKKGDYDGDRCRYPVTISL